MWENGSASDKMNCCISTTDEIVPTIEIAENNTVPRISPETLNELLMCVYDQHYHHVYVVDCRFPYKYNSGHIRGAMKPLDLDGK
jgi:hypothetical protein